MSFTRQQTPLCDLDDTWEDVLDEFKGVIQPQPAWSCFFLEDMDRELILSAPEVMDPKTDSGYGYEHISSLQHLLDTNEIPPASELNEERVLLDILDHIHVRELNYLKGYSLVQSYLSFPYFFRLDLLQTACPVLYAYCRGVLCTLDCLLRTVFATAIRSDEEFMAPPPELDRQTDGGIDQVIAALEAVAARVSNAAIAARLRWRAAFLAALHRFLEAKQREDVMAACELCANAATWLARDEFQRQDGVGAEPHVEARLQREREASFWVSVTAPTKPLAPTPFAEAMATYKTMLTQLASLKALLEVKTLNSVVDFVEGFAAQQTLLPVRCVAVVVLFGNDANESFLYGPSIQQRILHMLAKDYGSPLYQKIMEGDEALLESVVRYRIHKMMDPLKVTPDQMLHMRQQTVDVLRHWSTEAGKCFLVHLETMLCNRGLAHQRLQKALVGLSKFQELSYSTDITFFMVTQPGVAPSAGVEAVSLSTVLTLFANSYVLRTMELLLQFEIELDLLSQGELMPALWYLNFLQRAQIENYALLYLPNTSKLPAQRIHKKTRVPLYNLALTTRTVGAPDAVRVSLLGAVRLLTDALFLSACLIDAKGLLDLTGGAPSGLSTVERTFNQRLQERFGSIASPPPVSYRRCVGARPTLGGGERVPLYARRAREVVEGAAAKIRSLTQLHDEAEGQQESERASERGVERARLGALRGRLDGVTRTATAMAAALRTLEELCEPERRAEEYVAVVDRPTRSYLLNFEIRKKAEG